MSDKEKTRKSESSKKKKGLFEVPLMHILFFKSLIIREKGHCFRDVSFLDAAFSQLQLTAIKSSKSATKPHPLQAATPQFGSVLMGQYFLVVLYREL